MYGMGDYFPRLNPCIPESTQVPAWLNPQHRMKRLYGLNGCGCNGQCGSCGEGLGLFDNFSFGDWGIMEWGAGAVGAFVLFSVISTTGRGVTRVKRAVRRRRRKLRDDI